MNTTSKHFADGHSAVRTCFFLIVLMLASSLSPLLSAAEQPEWAAVEDHQSTGVIDFIPQANTTFVEAELEEGLVFDANRTFTDASLSLAPIWGSSSSNGTNFGIHSSNQWNGTHDQTNGIGHGGDDRKSGVTLWRARGEAEVGQRLLHG